MPPKNRLKIAPNQHDKRHENGLAPPGKRVTKKASNGHLDGQPNGKPGSAGQTPAAPIVNACQEGSTHGVQDHAGSGEGAERDRTYSDASMEEGGQSGEAGDARVEDGTLVGGGDVSACKPSAPGHVGNSWASMSTILANYPLRDAISILILLLSLPSTLVLVIQTLFASLTFVPPTTSISLSTLPNIKEMFNSANMGYPALATIMIVDVMFWGLWLTLWKPMQGILLDLSQAVIAVSLSGAAASAGGTTYSIATCTALVCIVHVLRYKAIHLTALDYLRSVLHKVDIGVPLDLSSAASYVSLPSVDRGWLYTVFRTILGIHIVSQGVTICIRRSLVKANEQGANVPAITKTDPEANAGADSNSRLSTGLVESTQHGVSAQNSDGRPPGPSLAPRDSKARESSTKKKRKQANQVRSQQPLWAAIASTKVTFVKEMEQREAVDDAREASRMDTAAVNTFTSSTNQNTDRLWIRELRDTEILFSVELSSSAVRERGQANHKSELNAGIDSSKPFYVQINGAAWSSTRIMMVDDEYDEENRKKARYDGEIFGLAPRSTYECQILAAGDHRVLCSASVITQPAPSPEQAASVSSQPTHQGLRPASPITTLKQSIQTAESKLNETRNRSKKLRKDRRTEQGEIKREIGRFRAQLDTSGGSDEKQRVKLAQANQHRAQADESAADFKKQYGALGETPPEDTAQSDAARGNWRAAEGTKGEANRQLDNAKSAADNEITSLKAEISQTESRREKLATRLIQRTEELDKAMNKAQADMTAKQKRDHERSQLKEKREKESRDAHTAIAALEQEAESLSLKTHDTYQQIGALHSWSQQPPPYVSSPPTPDTNHPGTHFSLGSPQTTAFPPFAQPFNSPLHSQQPSIVNPQGGPRGRSSSMLSQYSGFTEDGEQYSFAPELPRAQSMWPMHAGLNGGVLMDDRKESEGSGSASLNNDSTGSNSPRPDARVFVPGKTPGVIGPIGPPNKSEKSSQSPVTSPGTIGSGR